jgi:hypothetical protein
MNEYIQKQKCLFFVTCGWEIEEQLWKFAYFSVCLFFNFETLDIILFRIFILSCVLNFQI